MIDLFGILVFLFYLFLVLGLPLLGVAAAIYFYLKNRKKEEQLERKLKDKNSRNI